MSQVIGELLNKVQIILKTIYVFTDMSQMHWNMPLRFQVELACNMHLVITLNLHLPVFGKHGGSSGSALGWFLRWMRNLIWCNLIYLPSPSPHIPLEKLTQTQCHGTASDHHWGHLKSTFDLLQVEWQMNSLSNFLSIRHFSCIWLNCLFFFYM